METLESRCRELVGLLGRRAGSDPGGCSQDAVRGALPAAASPVGGVSAGEWIQLFGRRCPVKILIAEDARSQRNFLAGILRKWGHDVVVTPDGVAAWAEMCRPDAPAMAILDWVMPGMDGLSLVRKLRSRTSGAAPYLILLTSRGETRHMVRALEAGADDFVVKPFEEAVLRARIHAGRRILALQAEREERARLQGVLEMAGAICHEMNQPLQYVSGYCDLLLSEDEPQPEDFDMLADIRSGLERIRDLTRRILRIHRYAVKPYADGEQIVDIEEASRWDD